ncbi:MAG: 50S ribosomal protein L4 [Brevinemataceae bacterium]
MKFDVFNADKKVREVELSPIWENASGKCVHQVIVARLANQRQGTASTKTRAEVTGTGAKPFRQKGLGRARRGSYYSPLIRGGGVTFGPKPRDYSQHINKKQKANAYIFILAELYKKGALKVIESVELKDSKTKSFQQFLASNFETVSDRVVVVDAEYNQHALRACSNLPKISYFGVEFIDILPLFYAKQVLITEAALRKFDERYTGMIKIERG